MSDETETFKQREKKNRKRWSGVIGKRQTETE